MSINYNQGQQKSRQLISYILQQRGKVEEEKLVAYADQFLGLDGNVVEQYITYLRDEALLAVTLDLESNHWIEPSDALGRHLPGAIENQLAIWCSPQIEPDSNLPVPRGRGAPLGNSNALRHGKYSQRLTRPYGDHLPENPLDLQDELDLMRSIVADLNALDERPVELILKGVAMIGKLAIAQATLAPTPPPPPGSQEGDSYGLPKKT